MNIVNVITARDNAASPPGTRKTGLTPTWVQLVKLADGSAVTPQPAIAEIGQGQYKFTYDAETLGEAAGQIDLGSGLANPADRYVDVVLTRDSSRVQSGIDATGLVRHDLTQAIPTSNTAQTVGDALNAARAQGFGKWALTGTSLVLYAGDGTTIVRTFTLDSATAPTART